jgi:hypothetical protein
VPADRDNVGCVGIKPRLFVEDKERSLRPEPGTLGVLGIGDDLRDDVGAGERRDPWKKNVKT